MLNIAWKQGRMTTKEAAIMVMLNSITMTRCVGIALSRRVSLILTRNEGWRQTGEVELDGIEAANHPEANDGDSGITRIKS